MKTKDIKTINVITKTWFDKINGNTYFSQRITVNFGLKNEIVIINPYQYGYSSFDHFAKKRVMEALNLKTDLNASYNVCGYGKGSKIRFENTVIENCKKRDLINI